MEHIINFPSPRKLWLVRLLFDRIEYLEKPKELCLQLAILLSLNVLAIQPYFFAGGVALDSTNSLVMSLFLKFLDIMKVFVTYNQQLSKFCSKLVYQLELGAGVDFLLVQFLRLVVTV